MAVGVVYYFKNGKLNDVKYYSPSSFFEPIIFQDPFSDIELDLSTNIIRQRKEVSTAEKIIKEFNPNFVFMDGPFCHTTFHQLTKTLCFIHITNRQ